MVDDSLGCIAAASHRDALLVLNLPAEYDTSNRSAARSKGVITFKLDDFAWTKLMASLNIVFDLPRDIQIMMRL